MSDYMLCKTVISKNEIYDFKRCYFLKVYFVGLLFSERKIQRIDFHNLKCTPKIKYYAPKSLISSIHFLELYQIFW